MLRRALTLALLPLLATGCPASAPTSTSPMPGAIGSARAGSLSDLVSGSVITREEAELRDIQTRPTAMAFPVKVGVLFYQYDSALKAEDRQASLDEARTALMATGQVRDVFAIPSNFLKGNEGMDALRKLAARFQADVLLIVSGTQSFARSDRQEAGFFDMFSNRAAYEARMSINGLGLDVFAGTFMTPLQVATKAGPATLDPSDASFKAEAYKLQKQAEQEAFQKLREQLAAGLAAKRAEVETKSVAP